MARLLKRTVTGPYRVEIGGAAKFICGCGQSQNQPFYNGTTRRPLALTRPANFNGMTRNATGAGPVGMFPGIRSA